MDLKQRKLNKSEWESIEIPVSKSELDVLKMIVAGYHDVNIKINKNHSIFTFLKIEYSEKMEDYLYNKYLREVCDKIEKNLETVFKDYKKLKVDGKATISGADKIRLDKNDEKTIKKNDLYEFILLEHAEQILTHKIKENKKQFMFHFYTLYKLLRNNIPKINRHVISLCNKILEILNDDIDMSIIIENAVEFIEKNEKLLKYGDLTLYEHQKKIFTDCKNLNPKLVLYMAPTGTGKTLTPIALSEKYKIIFVCAARHVGLALARAAISVEKKVAFAFGCASAADIRLHYFSAKEFTKNKRSGGIGKVDNSVGDQVEIMICDIKSYLPAMYYMKSFNSEEDMIVYWDEPTITFDYEEHEFHKIIKQNWKENLIPNMVLSSATLPKLHELTETIPDFQNKFPGTEVYNIVSHDCKKSIPIINKDGFVVLPHYLNESYEETVKTAIHCENYLTLSRYFDLKEVVEFITYINKNNLSNSRMNVERYFDNLDDINMQNIKNYYIKLLQNISNGSQVWTSIYNTFKVFRQPRILSNEMIDTKGNKIKKSKSVGPGIPVSVNPNNVLSGAPLIRLASEQITYTHTHTTNNNNNVPQIGTSGVYVTTKDSYTLTDGPTIFISNDIEKIAKFCIQQANIPGIVMDDIMKKIEYNNILNEKIREIEENLETIKEKAEHSAKNNVSGGHGSINVHGRNKSSKDSNKINRETPDADGGGSKNEISKLTNEVNTIRAMIKRATLNDTFVPNKLHHLQKWADEVNCAGAFTSNIEEQVVNDIMLLNGIEDTWKVLLMMGIGVFINHENIQYTEIMKKMADEQKLYMIIASSDYIYGTNYQFCHGFLSKDLDLTQEKIIQAMGRIGRNNVQQNYTIRFRDDTQILKLFTSETDKPEIINMNKLFNCNNVAWDGTNYTVISNTDTVATRVV